MQPPFAHYGGKTRITATGGTSYWHEPQLTGWPGRPAGVGGRR